MSLLDLVDPLVGSDSHYGFSTGNCAPLCTVPFGMTSWSPQTAEGHWFFDKRARKLQGVRATHQPSPWISDYGHFVIMPQIGPLVTTSETRASAFRIDKSVVKPHSLKFEFIRYRTTMELAPTKRCSHILFTFPEGENGRVLLDPCAGEGAFAVCVDDHAITGYTRGNSGGCPENFAMYFYITFSKPIKGFGCFSGSEVHEGTSEFEGKRAGGYVEFGEDCGEVEMKVGTSFVSIHQAHINVAREIGSATFPETQERAERVWSDTLGKVEITTSDEVAKSTFYTCLYRTQLYPRFLHEEDGSNKVIHYSPYDGEIHDGPLVGDNGFWDTYRTIYPLFALLIPEKLGEMMQGWVNALKEGGWFPQWASPGYRACMVGTHIDVVVADAVVRGVDGFEVETALNGLLKHAYEPGDPAGAYGRIGIEDYKEFGFVAADRHDSSVARSLDYAYDDFCIAQVAKHLGRVSEASELLARSSNYKKLWDGESGFMRARNADGAFMEPFDPLTWGDPYVEGGAWQSTWAVQHDVAGLIELMDGPEKFVAKLTQMLTMRPDFNAGEYGMEIHEMTEMAVANFGQYAHSNQPVHHVLYLFAAAGYPWLTQKWVRKVMDEMYGPTAFPGDEDNGEMSAWYVLSALGLFPLTPGHGSWVLGAPRFEKAVLTSDRGSKLEISGSSDSSLVYTTSVAIDGEVVDSLWIEHGRLRDGAKVSFAMSASPVETVVTDSGKLPPSMSGV